MLQGAVRNKRRLFPPEEKFKKLPQAEKQKLLQELARAKPTFIYGCPVTLAGHDYISNNRFNRLNNECVADKCLCVLNKDVDNGASTENVRVPSLSGDIKTLLPRFSMPDLDDKYVEQVAKKINDGTVVSPEPLMFDAATWKHQFWTKYKANMQKIMDHLLLAMARTYADANKTAE